MELYTKYEQIQIENVCRICLHKKEHMCLICEAGFADMLLECASIQVTPENGLFNLVCRQCANEVSRWYVFKQQIIRSFEIGKWLLEKKPKSTDLSDTYEVSNAMKQDDCSLKSNSSSQSTPLIEDVHKLQNMLLGDSTNVQQNKCDMQYQSTNTLNSSEFQNATDNTTQIKNDAAKQKSKKAPEELLCTMCDKQCKSANSYNRHIRTHDDSRPFACSKCDKSFKTTQVLAEHMKRHYDDRRHKCEVCGIKYYAKASLNDHMRSHTGERPYKCDGCGKAFSTRAILRQHMSVHTVRERKYQCDICNKFLLTAGSLETHKRKHTGIKPFPCSACDKAFFSKEAMQRHYGAIHDTDNNFLCNVCSKVCTTKVHLTNHMRKKHLGLGKPPNAVCNDCGKQCGSAAELKVHVRVHTGERPYVCEICNKGFIAQGNLNAHKKRHTGEKPFLCNHCGKAFTEKSTLKVHERIHTGEHPYDCSVCGRGYVQSGALKVHMKTHWK